jgi:hypothetical protein
MATVSEIKTALATKLGTISGLRTYAYQPDNPAIPYAIPSLTSIEYHGAMGAGLVTSTYNIMLVVGRMNERTAEAKLDGYASYSGSQSVRVALETDRSLGGVVDDCIVTSASNITGIALSDGDYLMIEFTAVVYDS